MKFAEMLTYFRMKDMVKADGVFSQNQNYDKPSRIYVVRWIVVTIDDKRSVQIIYSTNGNRFTFIHADIHTKSRNDALLPEYVLSRRVRLAELKELFFESEQ